MKQGEEDHARPGWTTSRRGQDCLWKSQSEWQRTEINGESKSMVWPTLASWTAKEQNRQCILSVVVNEWLACLSAGETATSVAAKSKETAEFVAPPSEGEPHQKDSAGKPTTGRVKSEPKTVKQEPGTSPEMTAGKLSAATPASQVAVSFWKFRISFARASVALCQSSCFTEKFSCRSIVESSAAGSYLQRWVQQF